jgi:copper(I)-binding protein
MPAPAARARVLPLHEVRAGSGSNPFGVTDMNRVFIIAAWLIVGWVAPTLAQTSTAMPIMVENAWARATPGTIKTGGAYMTLVDHGTSADRLIGVATPVAGKAELHVMSEDNGIMKMRPVDAVPVEPGKPTELKPGGYHVMLIDLKQPLKEGDSFPMTLTFEKAGTIQVTVKVEKPGAMGPMPSASPAMPGMKM